MRVFPVVRKVVQQVVAAGNGFIAGRANAGTIITNRLAFRVPGAKQGTRALLSPATTTRALQRVGAVVSTRATGLTRAMTPVGVNTTNRTSGTPARTATREAARVRQVAYAYTNRNGSNAVAAYAVAGRTDFATPTNAQGKRDGSFATCNGAGGTANLTAYSGGLELKYLALSGKDDLALTRVELRFYGKLTGVATGSTGTLLLRWARDGVAANRVTLTTITANQDFSTTPLVYDLRTQATPVTTWAQVRALAAAVEFTGAALSSAVASIDAVELWVDGTLTEVY